MSFDGRTFIGPHVVGSNLPAPVATSGWVYLLPTLDLRTVVVFGRPGPELRHQLRALSRDVVVCARRRDEPAIVDGLGDTVDLVVVLQRLGPAARRFVAERADLPSWWLDATADSAVPSPDRWFTAHRSTAEPADGGQVLGLPMSNDHPTLSSPAARRVRSRAHRLARRVGIGRRREARQQGDPDRLGSTLALTTRPAGHARSRLVLPDGSAPAGWLERVGRDHDLAVEPGQWTVNVDGDYRSQKVWFRLPRALDATDVIVKVARDPRFAERLDTELSGLERLSSIDLPGAIPKPLFGTRIGRASVIAETALSGSPFEEHMSVAPDCPQLGRAVQWACQLAAATKSDDPVDATVLRAALTTLLRMFDERCRPDAAVRLQLEADVEAVAEASLPTVFVHGDLCVWNLMITESGELGILDWENAEPFGLPFWDITQLILSHARRSLDRQSVRATPERVAEMCAPGRAFGVRLESAYGALAGQLGVDEGLGRASARLFAAHQALKETTRRPPRRAATVYHARLLDHWTRRSTRPSP